MKTSVSTGLTNNPWYLGLDLSDINEDGKDVDIDNEDSSRPSAGDESRYNFKKI